MAMALSHTVGGLLSYLGFILGVGRTVGRSTRLLTRAIFLICSAFAFSLSNCRRYETPSVGLRLTVLRVLAVWLAKMRQDGERWASHRLAPTSVASDLGDKEY